MRREDLSKAMSVFPLLERLIETRPKSDWKQDGR